jgi:ACT domain-containing protein
MRAIMTVVGKDRVGIIAKVSTALAETNVNILDISQTILQDNFTMMMLVDLTDMNKDLSGLRNILNETGKMLGLSITLQHEEVFKAMHRIE